MGYRQVLKRHMPGALRQGLERLRNVLNGPGIEADVLHDTLFEPESDPTPRLTLIMPDLAASKAFGGVMTALTLAADLRQRLAEDGIAFRIVSEAPVDPADRVLDKVPGLTDAEVLSFADTGRRLPLRARELCLVYNWWISVNLGPALAAQAAHFNQPAHPRLHLIQEYEPQFYPFSAAHLVAHQVVGLDAGLWGIFNTRELYEYWQRQGHKAAKTFVFEPRMNAALRPHADGIRPEDKTRTLLVYGRPGIPRNAFFLIRRGLEAWGAAHGADHPDWRIVSAGMAHDDMPLGGGQTLKSLGKLSLDAYAGLLRETSLGLALMVSPHPSYPPLEMAHFGARVLTNAYTGKDPAARHDNLIALADLHPAAMAEAIEAEIRAADANPGRGLAGESRMPDFMGPEEIDCAPALAESIRAALAR